MTVFKNFLKTSIRFKRWTQKRTREVYNMPMEKLALGTVAVVVPGGMLISGVYVAANEIRDKYLEYAENAEKNHQKPQNFIEWFGDNYEQYFGEKKEQVLNTVNQSIDCSFKKVESIGDYIADKTVSASTRIKSIFK